LELKDFDTSSLQYITSTMTNEGSDEPETIKTVSLLESDSITKGHDIDSKKHRKGIAVNENTIEDAEIFLDVGDNTQINDKELQIESAENVNEKSELSKVSVTHFLSKHEDKLELKVSDCSPVISNSTVGFELADSNACVSVNNEMKHNVSPTAAGLGLPDTEKEEIDAGVSEPADCIFERNGRANSLNIYRSGWSSVFKESTENCDNNSSRGGPYPEKKGSDAHIARQSTMLNLESLSEDGESSPSSWHKKDENTIESPEIYRSGWSRTFKKNNNSSFVPMER